MQFTKKNTEHIRSGAQFKGVIPFFWSVTLHWSKCKMFLPGHASVLHSCMTVAFPAHSAPPCWAGTAIVLFLSSVPPPQVTEQVAHSLHVDHSQSTVNIVEYTNVMKFTRRLNI